jgi:hypothetical protein
MNIFIGIWNYLFGFSFHKKMERLEICYKCNGGREVCPVCKCFVELKTGVKSEKCPNGLWQ